jgi:hypothetical protein
MLKLVKSRSITVYNSIFMMLLVGVSLINNKDGIENMLGHILPTVVDKIAFL